MFQLSTNNIPIIFKYFNEIYRREQVGKKKQESLFLGIESLRLVNSYDPALPCRYRVATITKVIKGKRQKYFKI